MRLPLAVKLALLTLPVLAATGLAQWWWLDRAASGPARVAAVVVPLALPTLCTFLFTRIIVARYTQPLIDAYRRVAGGDLTTRMPPPPSAEFVTVREAFTAMSEALDAHVQRLRDADAERRRLFADLAHELATPTTTLLGVAEALQHGAGERTGALLDHLVHETARLERLIADVRELARLDEPALRLERSPCDVAALARGVAGRAQLAAAGHAITCDAATVTIDADPARIEQAVTNLVRNAVVHAGTGRAARIAVTAGPHAGGARITVDDDGPGVPADHLGQLGRRLWRADPSRSRERGGGSGLGLSIVLAIAADHGGTVGFARSALGGLRVELIFPA
ncbi:MAG TPA: HAMP domain-containing sensor histidine kinase [Kofleriaceae bacterium]|jgi:two-component system OmpR family sensor kinase